MAWLKMVEFPTRLCEVKGELGYFHLWEQWSNVEVHYPRLILTIGGVYNGETASSEDAI